MLESFRGQTEPRIFPDQCASQAAASQQKMELLVEHTATPRRQQPQKALMPTKLIFQNHIKRIKRVILIALEAIFIYILMPFKAGFKLGSMIAKHSVAQKRVIRQMIAVKISKQIFNPLIALKRLGSDH